MIHVKGGGKKEIANQIQEDLFHKREQKYASRRDLWV